MPRAADDPCRAPRRRRDPRLFRRGAAPISDAAPVVARRSLCCAFAARIFLALMAFAIFAEASARSRAASVSADRDISDAAAVVLSVSR